jgi:general secretion pathway protein G
MRRAAGARKGLALTVASLQRAARSLQKCGGRSIRRGEGLPADRRLPTADARRPARPTGFTLIELVITVAIVGVLAMMATPLVEVAAQRQKEAELRLALRQIRGAIDAYHQAVLDKRVESPADASGYPPNLDVLAKGVPDITKPDGTQIYFLRRLPRDPFDPDPQLGAAETWGKRSYASPPDDPQEGEDVFDVHSLSNRVGLDGVPYREW